MGPKEGYKNDQRNGTSFLKGLAGRAGVYSLKKRRFWRDLTLAFKYLKGACKKDAETYFSRSCCDTRE